MILVTGMIEISTAVWTFCHNQVAIKLLESGLLT